MIFLQITHRKIPIHLNLLVAKKKIWSIYIIVEKADFVNLCQLNFWQCIEDWIFWREIWWYMYVYVKSYTVLRKIIHHQIYGFYTDPPSGGNLVLLWLIHKADKCCPTFRKDALHHNSYLNSLQFFLTSYN